MSRASIHVTRTGIPIGGAYVPPPPAPGSEADRIQAALLLTKNQRREQRALAATQFLGFVVLAAVAAVVLIFA